jgi:hypothetical protein
VKKLSLTTFLACAAAVLLFPYAASAQQAGAPSPRLERLAAQMVNAQQTNVPPEVQRAEAAVERAVRRFRMGVQGGVGLDPELIMFGAFGPFFTPTLEFRPGVEIGIGEVTTALSINLDVLYTLPGATRGTRWTPYIGAGPNFSLSHRSFEADDDFDRFDFSDTSFKGGFNFIAGARAQNGMFLELKGTAYGVSNIRLLVGFNF